VLLKWVGLVEYAAPPVEAAVELDVAIEELRVYARVDHYVGPASEYLLAMSVEPRDQSMEPFAAVGASEKLVDRRSKPCRIEHGLGCSWEGAFAKFPVRDETSKL
jgi:hypothetical protein